MLEFRGAGVRVPSLDSRLCILITYELTGQQPGARIMGTEVILH